MRPWALKAERVRVKAKRAALVGWRAERVSELG